MGGGSLFRFLPRVVGAAAIGAPISSAFCHASARPSVSSYDSKTASSNCSASAASPKGPVVLQAQADGWVDGGHEEDRFVFGPVPTETEVKEATEELQAAFHLYSGLTSDPPVEDGYTLVNSSHVLGGSCFNGHMQEPSNIGNEYLVSSALIPYEPCTRQVALQSGENSSVYQAFHLLQTNPQIQGAVMSLACDPAVWKAVQGNEKVKEIIQSFHGDGDNSEAANGKGFFTKIYSYVTHTFSNVMGKIINTIGSIYDSVCSLSRNEYVTTCLMLAVAVVIVVLIKRKR